MLNVCTIVATTTLKTLNLDFVKRKLLACCSMHWNIEDAVRAEFVPACCGAAGLHLLVNESHSGACIDNGVQREEGDHKTKVQFRDLGAPRAQDPD